MGRDESGTLARLREHRKRRFEPTLARHGGRLVKLTGDGALAEFPSAVDALGAAIEFQQAMAEANEGQSEDTAIVFRIGLHLGDLIVEGDDLYGDGVNVAARLEAEAPAGGIVISRTVHESVAGRLKVIFDDLGPLALKNIERPVQAFSVRWEPENWKVSPPPILSSPPADAPLALPDKPSIAVLPFQNMTGDSEQSYFADGVVDDLITALARFPSLFVIARNSSFAYRGEAVEIRQVGRELGVRYVVEGGVRRAGNKIRISAQLIDVESRAHIWAERYDGELDDLFEVQDRVASSIAGALVPSIKQAEVERARRKPPDRLDAYDLYLQALALSQADSREDGDRALALLDRSLALAPDFAPAVVLAAYIWGIKRMAGWVAPEEGLAKARVFVLRALRLDRDNPDLLALVARGMTMMSNRADEALATIERAVTLNPNSATCWLSSGWVNAYAGKPEIAIDHFHRALRLSPRDPLSFDVWSGLAFSHILLSQDDEAIAAAHAALRHSARHGRAWHFLASALALAGRRDEAQTVVRQILTGEPDFSIAKLLSRIGMGEGDADRYLQGLRLAGVPETFQVQDTVTDRT